MADLAPLTLTASLTSARQLLLNSQRWQLLTLHVGALQASGLDAGAVAAWLASRDPVRLRDEVGQNQGHLKVSLANAKGAVRHLQLQDGLHFKLPPSVQSAMSTSTLANGSS